MSERYKMSESEDIAYVDERRYKVVLEPEF